MLLAGMRMHLGLAMMFMHLWALSLSHYYTTKLLCLLIVLFIGQFITSQITFQLLLCHCFKQNFEYAEAHAAPMTASVLWPLGIGCALCFFLSIFLSFCRWRLQGSLKRQRGQMGFRPLTWLCGFWKTTISM